VSEPLVSVVIPVHDGERYLGAAIESVLAQDYGPLEIIVVDDGSADASRTVAESYPPPVRVVSRTRGGIGAARNTGVEQAEGELLGFLDADDLWEPDKLERQLGAFAEDPRPDIVLGLVQQFHSPELSDAARRALYCPPRPQAGYLASAMLLRKETFARVGPFETERRVGEFVDWIARARELGLREQVLPEVVLARRLHGDNSMIRWRDDRRDYLHVLKSSLDRRRKGGQR
jgi:glycosyltransferase involved in cell wall biosynthesis